MNITAFAQYAGVSKAAVSRYFNGGYLSAEKRAQIAAAVEATGYRPSMQAQMLRTRRTKAAPAWWRASAGYWTTRTTSCC